MQRFFLVLFTLSGFCATSQVVFLGKMIRMPLLGDRLFEGIATSGGNETPGERGITPVSIEFNEVNSIHRKDPITKEEDKSTQNPMRRLLNLVNKPERPTNGAADQETTKAAGKATIVAEEAAKSVVPVAEEAAKSVAAAAEEAAKAIAAATAEDANIAFKVSAAIDYRCPWLCRGEAGEAMELIPFSSHILNNPGGNHISGLSQLF